MTKRCTARARFFIVVDVTNKPEAAARAGRRSATGSHRTCAQYRSSRPQASCFRPQSAPAPLSSAGAGRFAPRSLPAGKLHQRPLSRPNGRPFCRLFPKPNPPRHMRSKNVPIRSDMAGGGQHCAYHHFNIARDRKAPGQPSRLTDNPSQGARREATARIARNRPDAYSRIRAQALRVIAEGGLPFRACPSTNDPGLLEGAGRAGMHWRADLDRLQAVLLSRFGQHGLHRFV